ncbi:MAG TPA: hypothetical protein PLP88_14060 [Bacteroidales bacterium]|nr:hypothetical protein [Bacteroidales bacterium]
MRTIPAAFFITIMVLVCLPALSQAQAWQFVKEKDGIRLFTRQEANTSLKSFHGTTEFRGNFDKVCSLIGDPKNLDWWGEDVKNIRVLSFEKDKLIKY